eukprot:maker-scaffold1000_size72005-snap-gene-0.6 protein:Tk09934 transcript:maker-scaffold1000_size72005-snap-gene-0.6-mRNA-1 annotation:"histone-lysine n-methyltransferase setmar"
MAGWGQKQVAVGRFLGNGLHYFFYAGPGYIFSWKKGIKPPSHPPYCPDLAPADFFLSPKCKKELAGVTMKREDVTANLDGVCRTIPIVDFVDAFHAWKRRWEKCIQIEGANTSVKEIFQNNPSVAEKMPRNKLREIIVERIQAGERFIKIAADLGVNVNTIYKANNAFKTHGTTDYLPKKWSSMESTLGRTYSNERCEGRDEPLEERPLFHEVSQYSRVELNARKRRRLADEIHE